MTEQNPTCVAAFDLDGTLTEGGSVFPWLRYLAGANRVNRAALRLAVPLVIGAVRSGASVDRAKERLFRTLLAGRDLDEVTAASHDFELEHLVRAGRPAVLARLAWHVTEGHDVVIVSASPELYVKVVAEALGARGALGTRLAVDARGRLSGGFLGQNCRGSEKLRRLHEWIEGRGYPEAPVVYAYGNSRGDKKMLAEAQHPFNVGRLGWLGALRRYPRLSDE